MQLVLLVGLSLALSLVAYTYAGYPLVLVVLTSVWSRSSETAWELPADPPSVAMVVPAHNEADVIEQKVENTESVRYPGSFEAVVVSDSTDETDAVVEQTTDPDSPVSLLSLDDRRGKSRAINAGVAATESDVVVFSDANTMYDPDAVSRLVAPLADDAVGCTTGHLALVDGDGDTVESSYWRYELWLRRLESRLGTTVSTNGGVLAVRRDAFDPLPERIINDDLVITLRRVVADRRVVFAEEARATERTTGSLWAEYRRRVRIAAGNVQALSTLPAALSPRRGVAAVEFLSHKVLRWCVPALLLVVLGTTVVGVSTSGSPVFAVALALQATCYAVGVAGLLSRRLRSFRPVALPAYFLLMNAGLAVGTARFLAGRTADVWTPTR